MAETTYGVYVSIRNAEGVLWSSSRAEWVEVEKDLDATFGEGFGRALVESLRESLRRNHPETPAPPPAPAPAPAAPAPAPAPMTPTEAQALETVQKELGATPAAPQQQFEPCNVCGTLKDKWNPPGVSKSGKRYAGFFGCPNYRNHPRTAA